MATEPHAIARRPTLASGAVRVVDLTQPLSENTPVLQLPAAVRQHAGPDPRRASAATTTAAPPGRGTCSRSASTSAPTSTRRSTGSPAATARTSPRVAAGAAGRARGRDRQVRRGGRGPRLPAHASTDVRGFEAEHGALPDGGWLLLRTGWDARAHDQDGVPQRATASAHARPRRRVRALARRGVAARRLRRRDGRHRRGRRALASTRRSRSTTSCSARASTGSPSSRTSPSCRRPGALVVVAPLKLVGGTGSPSRVFAFVPTS